MEVWPRCISQPWTPKAVPDAAIRARSPTSSSGIQPLVPEPISHSLLGPLGSRYHNSSPNSRLHSPPNSWTANEGCLGYVILFQHFNWIGNSGCGLAVCRGPGRPKQCPMLLFEPAALQVRVVISSPWCPNPSPNSLLGPLGSRYHNSSPNSRLHSPPRSWTANEGCLGCVILFQHFDWIWMRSMARRGLRWAL
jgi:hypothetical protein